MMRSLWRVETNHDKLVQAARGRVFVDYRMQIREFVVDTREPAGHLLMETSTQSPVTFVSPRVFP